MGFFITRRGWLDDISNDRGGSQWTRHEYGRSCHGFSHYALYAFFSSFVIAHLLRTVHQALPIDQKATAEIFDTLDQTVVAVVRGPLTAAA